MRIVELMFSPDEGGTPELSVDVDEPNAPTVTPDVPDVDDFDLETPEGVAAYVDAVKDCMSEVDRLKDETSTYEDEVDEYVNKVNAALDEALGESESPELFQTHTTGVDVHQEMDSAGFLTGDECVVILRGHYDRLIGDGSACVFGSNGTCIHRECGLTREALTDDDSQHVCTFDELTQMTISGGNVKVCLSPKCGREVPANG